MSYTIDERNPERQQLLNALLEPHTRDMLARLPPIADARCLDLGCGQGNTTRVLADALRPAECIGAEYDARRVDYFRNAGASGVQAGEVVQLEHKSTVMRRSYRLSAEATGSLAVTRGIFDEAEARAMLDGLVALENDPAAVVTKFPDMRVIATR